MARTLWNRQHRDLGFDPRNALRGEIAFSDSRYDDPATVRAAVAELRQAIAGQSGVRVAAVSAFAFAGRLGSPIPITEPGGSSDLLGPDTPRVIESVSPGSSVRWRRRFAAAAISPRPMRAARRSSPW
jgi:hypothetical protein